MANAHPSNSAYDCVVIGSGPGGYVAAIRVAQLGLKTAVVERDAPGGICLNWGCIPTKALLKSAEVYSLIKNAKSFGIETKEVTANFDAIMKRSRQVVGRMTKGVQFLLKKNKVDFLKGHGRLIDTNKVEIESQDGSKTVIESKNIILATGARARTLPGLPIDEKQVITSKQALAVKECPKKLLVIGAGAIGVEFAYFFNTFGAEVTLVEVLDRVLPIEDMEISAGLQKCLKRSGIKIQTGSKVQNVTQSNKGITAVISKDDSSEEWTGDMCLVAVGVQGNIEDLGLEKVGINTDRSYIQVNEKYETNVPGIYAIGDIIGPPWLAHVASHEGIATAEIIAGQIPHAINYQNVPGCTYCIPQVGSIGMTEQDAVKKGLKIRIGRFSFAASGKAVAIGETEGFVKVIVDEELDEVLGIHILHPEATELIGEAAIILSHKATANSVMHTIHAHPTLSEAIMDAMENARSANR